MNRIEVDSEARKLIVDEYVRKRISVEMMISKFNVSSRVFYRVLREEGIEIKRIPRKYNRPPKHNLTNQKFNHLFVESMEITEKSRSGTWRCICRCDCGRISDVNTNYLMRGLSKTCGHKECSYHRQDYSNNGKNNVKFTGYEEISGQLWSSYKCGAARRNFEFDIDIRYAWELFLSQNRKCSITKKDIFFGKTNTSEKTASLDRIDSMIGYVKGNVHWVHKDINQMKMDMSMEKFISICRDVTANN